MSPQLDQTDCVALEVRRSVANLRLRLQEVGHDHAGRRRRRRALGGVDGPRQRLFIRVARTISDHTYAQFLCTQREAMLTHGISQVWLPRPG